MLFLVACGNRESASTDTIASSRGSNSSSAQPCKVPGKISRLGGTSTICALDGKSRALFTVTKLTSRRCPKSGQLKPQGLDLAVCARSGLLQRWAVVVNPFNTPESSPMNDLEPETVATSAQTTIPMPENSPLEFIGAATPPTNTGAPSTTTTRPAARPIPATVPAGESMTGTIKTGFRFACALVGDGSVACWGDNSSGQIGEATFVCIFSCGEEGFENIELSHDSRRESIGYYVSPTGQQLEEITVRTRVPGVTDAIALEVGYDAACAIVAGGRVICWGSLGQATRTEGSVENGDQVFFVKTPKTIAELENVRDVAVGKGSACAVLADGSVHCWGANLHESLFAGNANKWIFSPTRVPGVNNASTVTAVSSGYNSSFCAVLRDSTAKCWSIPQELGLLRQYFPDPGAGFRNEGPEEGWTRLAKGVHTYGNIKANCSAAEAYVGELETALADWFSSLTAGERTVLNGREPADIQFDSEVQSSPAAQAYYDLLVERAAIVSQWQNAPECEISITPLRGIKEIIAPESCFCWGQWELCVTDLSNNLSCASTTLRGVGVDNTLAVASTGFRKIEIGRHLNSSRGNVVACWDSNDGDLLCNGGLNNSLYPLPDVIDREGFLGSRNLSDHVHAVDLGRPVVDFSLFDMMVCALTDDDRVYCWEKSEFSNYVGKARRYKFA